MLCYICIVITCNNLIRHYDMSVDIHIFVIDFLLWRLRYSIQ